MLKERLSSNQLFCLVVLILVGPPELRLPQLLAHDFGVDAIWVTWLYGLLLLIPLYAMSRLARLYPGQPISQYVPRLFGNRGLGSKLGQSLYFLIFGLLLVDLVTSIGVMTRTFVEPITDLFLYTTPNWVLFISTLLVLGVAALHRLTAVFRLGQLLFPLTLLFWAFVMTVCIWQGRIEYLFPWFENLQQRDWSLPKLHTSFIGLEVLLVYLASVGKRTRMFKASCWGLVLALFLKSSSHAASLTVFGLDELISITWPTLDIFEESWFFVSSMLFIYFFICFAYVILLIAGLNRLIGQAASCDKKTATKWTWLLLTFSFVITLFPSAWTTLDDYYFWLSYGSGIFIFVVPLLLWLLASFRSRRAVVS